MEEFSNTKEIEVKCVKCGAIEKVKDDGKGGNIAMPSHNRADDDNVWCVGSGCAAIRMNI